MSGTGHSSRGKTVESGSRIDVTYVERTSGKTTAGAGNVSLVITAEPRTKKLPVALASVGLRLR